MEKSTIKGLGKGLQRTFVPPEDLPYPMRKALEALAKQPYEARDNDAHPPLKTPCCH